MKVIIDTCSWKKVEYLKERKIADLFPFLYGLDLWATHQLLNELRHYMGDILNFEDFSIQRVEARALKEFSDKKLDDADLSIIEFARINQDVLVISDDRYELLVLGFFDIKCFQLSEYVFLLAKFGRIKKNRAFRIIKELRKSKNITERKKEILLKKITQIR